MKDKVAQKARRAELHAGKKAEHEQRRADRKARKADKARSRALRRQERLEKLAAERAARVVARRPGDIAAGTVHIVGAAFALASAPVLIVKAAASQRADIIVGASLYSATLLYYFVISAVAHLLKYEKARRVLNTLDLAGSYFLVAGSWTPLCFSVLKGPEGWVLFGLLWGFAICDFIASLFYIGRLKDLALNAYYVLFTFIVPLLPFCHEKMSDVLFAWILLAGALYCFGLSFRSRDTMPYQHSIWHSFTVAASICHFFGVLSLHY